MKKAVFKLEVNGDKVKKKAIKTVVGLPGVDSVSMDVKNLTVIGDIDPVCILSKLRKLCNTEIVSVGPAKEPEMKDDEKKKKDDEKKKKDDEKKPDANAMPSYYSCNAVPPYYSYNAVPPHYSYNAVPPHYSYTVDSADENTDPIACVIC